MSPDQLTAALAERFMGWKTRPDRFVLGNRQWIRRTQFEPLNRVQDAFRLLNHSANTFSLAKSVAGVLTATVQIGDLRGTASGKADAETITRAIARAIGLDLEDGQ